MAKVALIGTIDVTPGCKAQLVAAFRSHMQRCLKDEPGTMQMEILAPRGDDTKLLVYEVYQDNAAFELHRIGPSLSQWRAETAGMVVKFSATRYEFVNDDRTFP